MNVLHLTLVAPGRAQGRVTEKDQGQYICNELGNIDCTTKFHIDIPTVKESMKVMN